MEIKLTYKQQNGTRNEYLKVTSFKKTSQNIQRIKELKFHTTCK